MCKTQLCYASYIDFIILNFVSKFKLDNVIVKIGIFFLQKTVTYRTEATHCLTESSRITLL